VDSIFSNAPIKALWGSGAGGVYAVAAGIFHYDGASWSHQRTGTTNPLASVWGTPSGSVVLAAGYYGTILRQEQ
jgi:hypothetical protein